MTSTDWYERFPGPPIICYQYQPQLNNNIKMIEKFDEIIYDNSDGLLLQHNCWLICQIHDRQTSEFKPPIWKLRIYAANQYKQLVGLELILNWLKDNNLVSTVDCQSIISLFPKLIMAFKTVRLLIDRGHCIDISGWRCEPMGIYAVQYDNQFSNDKILSHKYEVMLSVLNKELSPVLDDSLWSHIIVADRQPEQFALYDKFLGLVQDKKERAALLYEETDSDDSSSE